MTCQFGEPDDEDLQCSFCTAYFCNEFALSNHYRQCQARVSKEPIEEPDDSLEE